ncbi:MULTISPECIES: iron-sulfur cluster assembly scaffold protein [Sinorhizobium]|uniref:iron-sulfur cluster assembly scaffold protein n=1 Tax=Sinorhizobium TaxID=28105 RepID=UPI0009B6F8F3|nr:MULTISPECIES: iron-sulfur cluster assembly scaffold protein [Sinorhizobium]WOS66974.1 iron-sulfur cluster assembly scaffold protein [Sinorhizobium fredii GR64]
MGNNRKLVEGYFFNAVKAGVLEFTKVGAISCGNRLDLMMTRVDPGAEAITAAKSQLLRCSSAIAVLSEFADRIVGTIADEACRLTHRETAGFIDRMLQERMHRPAMRIDAKARFRGMGRIWPRERGAPVCKSFSVDEGVIIRTSAPTVSPPAGKSLTTRSLVAAESRLPKHWRKCLSGAVQQCSPKPSLRERRRVRKTKTPVDANPTYRITVKGMRSPETCRDRDTRNVSGVQTPSAHREPQSRVWSPQSPLIARATNGVEHTNVHVAPRWPRMRP